MKHPCKLWNSETVILWRKKCGCHLSFNPVCDFEPPVILQSILHWEKKRLRGREMFLPVLSYFIHSHFTTSCFFFFGACFLPQPAGRAQSCSSRLGLVCTSTTRKGPACCIYLRLAKTRLPAYAQRGSDSVRSHRQSAALSRPTSWKSTELSLHVERTDPGQTFIETTDIRRCAASLVWFHTGPFLWREISALKYIHLNFTFWMEGTTECRGRKQSENDRNVISI